VRFYTPKEVADKLGITRNEVYSLIHRGKLEALQAGWAKAIRISEAALRVFLGEPECERHPEALKPQHEPEAQGFRHFTVRQVSEQLAVSHKTIRSLISKGTLQAVKVGGAIRISEQALRAFLQAHEVYKPPVGSAKGTSSHPSRFTYL
jgi:excisionase family DNA binding protein